jgi:phosphopantetheinyl transferase
VLVLINGLICRACKLNKSSVPRVPLFFEYTINQFTRLAIWKIEEEEAFFSSQVPFHREITHPNKRLQHLAGRYMLQHLVPRFPYELLVIADTRKPYLSNEAYHFSISHCENFAAAIVSSQNRVGVDIEFVKPQITRISNKFLSAAEVEIIDAAQAYESREVELTTCWSSKEAIYKWYGYGGVDFKKHMVLQSIGQEDEWLECNYLFAKENEVQLQVLSRIFENLVLAFVVT